VMIREIDGDAEERAADFVKAKRGQAAIGYTDDFGPAGGSKMSTARSWEVT
jgi:succinyl-CoA synthetase alpha subunit